MSKDNFNSTVILYGHENIFLARNKGEDILAYYVHLIFNRDGVLNSTEFLHYLKENILDSSQYKILEHTALIGPFHVLADLEACAVQVAQYLRINEIGLLSTIEFNEVVQLSANIDELYANIEGHARYLELSDQQKKRGFLSSLFGS